jgi:hypothetical protein
MELCPSWNPSTKELTVMHGAIPPLTLRLQSVEPKVAEMWRRAVVVNTGVGDYREAKRLTIMHGAIPPLPLRLQNVELKVEEMLRRALVVNLSKQPVLVSTEVTVTAVSVSCTDKGTAKCKSSRGGPGQRAAGTGRASLQDINFLMSESSGSGTAQYCSLKPYQLWHV